MATRKECDAYAAELNERFEAFTQWAIQNWPNKNFPLVTSDFAASRRELGTIIGPKLGDGDSESHASEANEHPAYVSTTPMPWP